MKLYMLTTLAFVAGLVSAWTPLRSRNPGPPANNKCLGDSDAAQMMETYAELLGHAITGAQFNETAENLLAEGFTSQSSSLNAEEGKPVREPSCPSLSILQWLSRTLTETVESTRDASPDL